MTGGTIISSYPAVYRNNGIVTIGSNSGGSGGTILKISVGSSGSFPVISSGTPIPVCTIPTIYRPAQTAGGADYISGTIIKADSSNTVVATYPVIIQVNSGTGELLVRFVTAITAPASTDYFMLPLGGVSWNV